MNNYSKADSVLIDAAAFVPLYYGHKLRLLQNNVHALPINSMEYRDFTRVFLSKK
jgi:peptide/nickel transport system substrate-binding protein